MYIPYSPLGEHVATYEFTESGRAAQASLKEEGEQLLKKFNTAVDQHGPDSEEAKQAAGALGRNDGEQAAAKKLLKQFGME